MLNLQEVPGTSNEIARHCMGSDLNDENVCMARLFFYLSTPQYACYGALDRPLSCSLRTIRAVYEFLMADPLHKL